MPLFTFEPPNTLPDFALYAWQCLGKEAPSIPDLKFFLSFRAGIMAPSKAQEVIDTLIRDGLLINKNNILYLSDNLLHQRIAKEQKEKERIRVQLAREQGSDARSGSKGFNDYFRELLPDVCKNKTFLLKAKDVHITILDAVKLVLKIQVVDDGLPINIGVDGLSKSINHSCEFLPKIAGSQIHLCPHMGAFFRQLQKEDAPLALRLIQALANQKEKWRYVPP